MIRITQSYVISLSVEYLRQEGWEVIFYDRPGGRRSGVGLVAKINGILEGIYNLSPDVLAIQGNKLLLVEVDQMLTEEYFKKFIKYQGRSVNLMSSLSQVLHIELTELEYGFVAIQDKFRMEIPFEFNNFHYIYLTEEKLIGEILNSS
jgi:hypothetical protein